MIKYRVKGKFVEEETFYIALKKYYDTVPQVLSYDDVLEKLKTSGCVRIQTKKGKSYWYDIYEYFYMADEQVFELEQIVEDNEYDPEDCDAFEVAFAIYQKGFRRN